MRDFKLFVPSDCSAARSRREHDHAIEHIQAMSNANVLRSPTLRLGILAKGK